MDDVPGYLVIDTETSDLPDYKLAADADGQPRLAALTVIPVTPQLERLHPTYQALVRPDGWTMAPGASKVNGLTDEILHLNGIPVVEVLREYTRMVNLGWPVIAFNSRHDCKVMRGELRRAGMDDLFEVTANWCVMRAAGAVLKLKNSRGGAKWPRLGEACAHFGIPVVDLHTAAGDAWMCLLVARDLVKLGITIDARVHYAKHRDDAA